MFGSDGPGPVELQQHPGAAVGAAAGSGGGGGRASDDRQIQQTPVPFSDGRKPTPRSVRIVSMQSNAATTSTGAGAGSARRELGTDRTTTTRVSSSAGIITTPHTPHTPPSFPAWSRAAKASVFAKGGLSPTTLFFFLPRHRMPACATLSPHRPNSDLQACTSNSCATRPGKRASIFIYSYHRSRTRATPDVSRFQRHLLHLD
jgi:hypothetical protein